MHPVFKTLSLLKIIKAFRYYYALKVDNPYNYRIPKQIRLGVKLDYSIYYKTISYETDRNKTKNIKAN